jgi:hypothetical protein
MTPPKAHNFSIPESKDNEMAEMPKIQKSTFKNDQ